MLDKEDLQSIGEIMDTKLAQQKTEMMQEVSGMLAQQKTEMMQDVSGMMDTKLAQQKTEIMQDVSGLLAQQKTEIMQEVSGLMDTKLAQHTVDMTRKMNVLIESKVDPKINLLMEGHSSILEKLIPFPRIEKLEEKVAILEVAVRQLSK